MRRRGFTILELTLAAALGALVLLAALGVFSSLDRGDRTLAARAVQNTGLEMASGAIEKAMGTLVMDSGGQSPGNKTGGKAEEEEADPKAAPPGGRGSPAPSGRARFILEPDTTPGLPGMPDLAAPQAGTAGSVTMSGVLTAPQRLELVLARHPVPLELPAPASAGMLMVADPGPMGGPGGRERGDASPKAVRGAFDLRPEARKPSDGDGPMTWTLWWRPIERRVGDAGGEAYIGRDDLAVPLATGLLSARWGLFYEEAWKSDHSTGAVLELPAYVKLQVTTSAGLQADWLFEVGWTMGPEFQPPAPGPGEEGTTDDGQGMPAGGPTVGGSTAAQSRPAGATTTTKVAPGGAGKATRPLKPAPPARRPAGAPTSKPGGRPPAKPTGAPD
jgi:hypothetical protein